MSERVTVTLRDGTKHVGKLTINNARGVQLDGPHGAYFNRADVVSVGQVCQWFALCDREATTTVAHPILGDVPACERCAERARRD